MTASERIRNLIYGKSIDRLPIIEWAPWWDKTLDKWYEQGLDKNLKTVYEIQNYFGLDKCIQTLYNVRTDKTPQPKIYGGGIMKNRKDYLAIKNTMFLPPDKLYSKEKYAELDKTQKDGDTINFFTLEGFFWYPRELFGIENHLFSFYDESDLYKEMCEDYVDWIKNVVGFISNNFRFDFMSFAEDMSYNNGPMISKDIFNEFLAPYYKELIPIIQKAGIPVFIDSDGDITNAVNWYASIGVDGMFPLERQAGVDVSSYIQMQPNLTFLGHFDKMCMKFGKEKMRQEFERLLPSAQKGKVIFAVDHQTPPDVSLQNYKEYVNLFFEYASKIKR